GRRHPPGSAAQSPATGAPRPRRRTKAARPSSSDRTPPDPSRRRGTRRRTRPARSRLPHRAQTRPDDPSQPLPHARRQQKLLITIAGHEVERHRSLPFTAGTPDLILGPRPDEPTGFMRRPQNRLFLLPWLSVSSTSLERRGPASGP